MPQWKDWNDQMVAEWTTDPGKGDKGNYTVKDGKTYYPVWKTDFKYALEQNQKNFSNAPDPNKTAGGFGGVDYNFFNDMLKKMMAEGDPNQALYRQNIQGQVNKSFDRSGTKLKETLAGTGMLRSGAGAQGFADIEAGRSGAIANAEVGLAAQDQSFRQGALQKLLGLQELGLQELGSNRNYGLSLQQMLNSMSGLKEQMNYQKDQDKFNFFRDLLPGLIEGGGKVGAAFAAKSDRRLKENIALVGKSPSGRNIYEFNYIGGKQRYRGGMAQENPDASIEINGILFLDYSKTDIAFEAV